VHKGPRTAPRPSSQNVFTPSGRAPGGTLAVLDARPAKDDETVAILPTLLAALRGDARPQTAIVGGGRGSLLCLIVDTSGSMAAQKRLARVKGALEAALRRAYARRDLVAVVAFSGEGARTLVAPGTPIEQAAAAVHALPAGGRTPLAAGIEHAAALLEAAARGHHAGRARVAVLLTDGRASDRAGHARAALMRVAAASNRTVVVDLEDGRARLGMAAELAAAAGADLTRLVAPGDDVARRPPPPTSSSNHRSAA
jgi:magnesium chelatase subunit D